MELQPNGTVTAVQYVTTGATMDRESGDEKAATVRNVFIKAFPVTSLR